MEENMSIALTILGLIVGGFLGVALSELYHYAKRKRLRRNPLTITTARSHVPPIWFATNLPLPPQQTRDEYFDKHVWESEPFCGFSKINLEITNTSQDVVYITNIRISKTPVGYHCASRVRYIPQGSCSTIRLFALLDDDKPKLAENLVMRRNVASGFFERGDRIMVAPSETERVFMAIVSLNTAWRFNASIDFAIAGKTQSYEDILGEGEIIVPYIPDSFENDYCSFLEAVSPEYERFPDARFFTDEMRNPIYRRPSSEPSSALDYLQRTASS